MQVVALLLYPYCLEMMGRGGRGVLIVEDRLFDIMAQGGGWALVRSRAWALVRGNTVYVCD